MFLSWWSGRGRGTLAGKRTPPRGHHRLSVERLEERALLSGGPDTAAAPLPPATDPAATTVTTDTGTAVEDSGASHGGKGGNSGTPDPGTDSQRGYPLPPATGPALQGTVGADTNPVPMLPTSPGGPTADPGAAAGPAPATTGAAGTSAPGNANPAPAVSPTASSGSTSSTVIVPAPSPAAPTPSAAGTTGSSRPALHAHARGHASHARVAHHPAPHHHRARKTT